MTEDINLGLVALVVTLLGLLIAVVKDNRLLESIIARLTSFINPSAPKLSLKNLSNHNLFIKLQYYIDTNNRLYDYLLESPEKRKLFYAYTSVISKHFYNFALKLVTKDVIKKDDQELRAFILKEFTLTFNNIDEEFKVKLVAIHNDAAKIDIVIKKLAEWRNANLAIIIQNVDLITTTPSYASNLYKIDTLFSIYLLGVDLLFINSIDSFNKLNGQLDDFII
jgi:hypothetical protein